MPRRWWHVYLLRCADGTFYTGMTLDLERRLAEHNAGPRGARYTRSRRPVTLLWSKRCTSRVAAMREELRVKRLKRRQKEALAERRGARQAHLRSPLGQDSAGRAADPR